VLPPGNSIIEFLTSFEKHCNLIIWMLISAIPDTTMMYCPAKAEWIDENPSLNTGGTVDVKVHSFTKHDEGADK
jgi:hypothetical protein